MPEANTIQWPSIAAFPKHCCHTIETYLAQCETAAAVVQATFRHTRSPTQESENALHIALGTFRSSAQGGRWYSQQINDYFCKAPVVATQKYDGTNVGKDETGAIYGRRQMIADTFGATYQKTKLTAVSQVDTKKMKADLFAEIGATVAEKESFTMVAYGELMCNHSLFDYEERSLSSGWFIFGAILRHKMEAELKASIFDGDDESEEAIIAAVKRAEVAAMVEAVGAKLTAAGYSCHAEHQARDSVLQVKIGLGDKLARLVEWSGGGATPKVCEKAKGKGPMSMHEVVTTSMRDWMMTSAGEGVVFTIPTTPCGMKACTLRKWKTASEPQGSNQKVLVACIEKVATLQVANKSTNTKATTSQDQHQQAAKTVACIHQDVIDMLDVMLAVSTATPPQQKASKGSKEKNKKGAAPMIAGPLDATLVNEAMVSALTKFDALDSFFSKKNQKKTKKKSPMDEIKDLLLMEMAEDMGVQEVDAAEMKQLKGTVSKHIGIEFGKFKACRTN
jgi:hypothetical protein